MRTLALALALGAAAPALAVPLTLTHQGTLADSAGTPLEGAHQLTLSLFAEASGGSPLWTDTVDANLDRGAYSVVLGAGAALDDALFDGTTRYVELAVDGGAPLPQRLPVTSVPYALRAGNSARAEVAATAEALAGGLAWDAIEGIPAALSDGDADTLGALSCASGEVAVFDGAAWACGSPSPVSVDASVLSGTVSVDNLPIGNSSGQVAAGDHTHAFSNLTGQAAIGQLPVGTASGTVAAGDHDHAFSAITGQAAIGQLPVGTTAGTVAAGNHTHTAAQVGAIPATGGAVDGSLALTGSMKVGATTAPCNTAAAGTLRWTGTQLEVCNGSAWSNLAQAEIGSSSGFAADSCAAIKAARPSAGNGAYWVKVGSSGGSRLVYCDQTTDGGGWTLAVNIQSDLGAINLYTYNNQHTNFTSQNYGVNLSEMGVATTTEYRLTCVESSDNATRKMFIKGLNPAEPIWQAAGTVTKTGVVCANNEGYASQLTGAACFLVDDGLHTYYGNAAWDMDWALFQPYGAYTLRHCRNIGGGYHNKGALWFR